jgi:hypothetical protein
VGVPVSPTEVQHPQPGASVPQLLGEFQHGRPTEPRQKSVA